MIQPIANVAVQSFAQLVLSHISTGNTYGWQCTELTTKRQGSQIVLTLELYRPLVDNDWEVKRVMVSIDAYPEPRDDA